MNIMSNEYHRWDLSPRDAARAQATIRERIVIRKIPLQRINLVAGVDVSIKDSRSRASIVVLSFTHGRSPAEPLYICYITTLALTR